MEIVFQCLSIPTILATIKSSSATIERAQPVNEVRPSEPTVDLLTDGNVRLTVNNREHVLNVDPWMTLLDVLRERLGLIGDQERL